MKKRRILKDWVAEAMLIGNFILLALAVSFDDTVPISTVFFTAIIVIAIVTINMIILNKYSRLFD